MMKKNNKQDIRTLCPKCAALYEESGYKLKQVNPEQNYERCMICNHPKGKDYVVSESREIENCLHLAGNTYSTPLLNSQNSFRL